MTSTDPLYILYRGPLHSCNYGCGYCPFAKSRETRAEHKADQCALEHFVTWVSQQTHREIGVFFTPWGEALIHGRYQRAMIVLSRQSHVRRVAIQTNLSGRLDWIVEANRSTLALWATYHPSETTREAFLSQCARLDSFGVRYSVGMVGLPEAADEIEAMRRALPDSVYLWINAYHKKEHPPGPELMQRFTAVDPLFPYNTVVYKSKGKPCRAGHTVISVDGDGLIYRCHFIKEPIGSIHHPDFEQALKPRLCTANTCHCHIGYVHMPELGMYDIFGDGILERIPTNPIWQTPGESG